MVVGLIECGSVMIFPVRQHYFAKSVNSLEVLTAHDHDPPVGEQCFENRAFRAFARPTSRRCAALLSFEIGRPHWSIGPNELHELGCPGFMLLDERSVPPLPGLFFVETRGGKRVVLDGQEARLV